MSGIKNKNIVEASVSGGVNEELRDLLLKRSHYVQMFENGTVKEVIQYYHTTKAELMRRVARLEQYGTGFTLQYRLDRLNSQIQEIDTILRNATDDAIRDFSYNFNGFANDQNEFTQGILRDNFGKINVNISSIPLQHVVEIVNTPIGGATYAERMINRYGEDLFLIKQELTQAVIQGQDMAKAGRRLFGRGIGLGGTIGERNAQQLLMIARTEIQRIQNSVNHRIYEENSDILKGEQYVATLDDRTCISCGVLDGKVFYFNKNPVSLSEQPPIHPLCRCTLAPITKSWRELGVNANEVSPGTRASFSGQVPEVLRYRDWLKAQESRSPGFALDILGPKRYKLWTEGRVNFEQMATSNRILTLEELRNKM